MVQDTLEIFVQLISVVYANQALPRLVAIFFRCEDCPRAYCIKCLPEDEVKLIGKTSDKIVGRQNTMIIQCDSCKTQEESEVKKMKRMSIYSQASANNSNSNSNSNLSQLNLISKINPNQASNSIFYEVKINGNGHHSISQTNGTSDSDLPSLIKVSSHTHTNGNSKTKGIETTNQNGSEKKKDY